MHPYLGIFDEDRGEIFGRIIFIRFGRRSIFFNGESSIKFQQQGIGKKLLNKIFHKNENLVKHVLHIYQSLVETFIVPTQKYELCI